MKMLTIIVILFSIQAWSGMAYAVSFPEHPAYAQVSTTRSIGKLIPAKNDRPVLKNRKVTWKQKMMLKLLEWKYKRKIGGIDEPTDQQRKLGKLSFIFAIGAVVLLLFPYAALAVPAAIAVASLPLSIAGLVLGIKSIKGNTNTFGLIGLIVSGSLLVLFLLAVALLAIFFSNGFY